MWVDYLKKAHLVNLEYSHMMDFLKSGTQTHLELEKADLAARAGYGPRRFFLKIGNEVRITFLDGDMENGLLNFVSYWEHMINKPGGGFDNFPCTQEYEPCPICERPPDGSMQKIPSLVFVGTILDHRIWKDKEGKSHQFEKRLFVCKKEVFKRLQMKATKYGGLTGVTLDVTRIGDKSAAVGSDFEFVNKMTPEQIMHEAGLKEDDVKPYVYKDVIKYYTADELRKLGFGIHGAVGSADVAAFKGKASGVGSGTFNPAKEM